MPPKPYFAPNMFCSGSAVFDNQSSGVWRELLAREANGTTGWYEKYGHTLGPNSPMLQNKPSQLMETLPNFSFAPEVTLKDCPYATAESCEHVSQERKRTLNSYIKNRNSTVGGGNRIYGWRDEKPVHTRSRSALPGIQSYSPLNHCTMKVGTGPTLKKSQRTVQSQAQRRHRLETTKRRLAESIQNIDSELVRVAS